MASEMLDKMEYTEKFKSLQPDDKLTFLAGEIYDIKVNCGRACPTSRASTLATGGGAGAAIAGIIIGLFKYFSGK